MLGKPKHNVGDTVMFFIKCNGKNTLVTGNIYVVDAYGTFEQNNNVSYDIETDDCIYKHVIENLLVDDYQLIRDEIAYIGSLDKDLDKPLSETDIDKVIVNYYQDIVLVHQSESLLNITDKITDSWCNVPTNMKKLYSKYNDGRIIISANQVFLCYTHDETEAERIERIQGVIKNAMLSETDDNAVTTIAKIKNFIIYKSLKNE